ncbi:Do family serine endopeptidase [Hyphomicrobium sp.]|uniref:Do family serine endopeptidase n=1 Tax=Hyphomicrobium sp. TaxID=82 RepID=UPI000FC087FA|nr:Do family serine endopeptidase [Hyphomicrobium sp.]MBN9246795.1 Do family serine endopeptidase [Hyphomicrobium sp.]RUP08200.1 MAG: Do family serine endopeptidase [Hyphomicrobium sp.]
MIKKPSALSVGIGFVALLIVGAAQPALATEFPNGPQSVAPLAKRLSDAVVNIATSQTVKGPAGVPLPKVPKGAPFEDFFDDFFNKRGGVPHGDRKISSLGSGFVIDGKEGLIVTNNHVIEGAEEIDINFHDGSKLVVDKILGRDTKADLALLKVSPKKPLADVKFGSSADIEVGDWVLAIGNPFGLGGSVSVGIISAKSRDINSGPYDDYLQTDAAINKGNSGGPLFNMNGEVIGVNTAIISPTGGSIGIGFAVPSDTVAKVIDQLKQYGEVRRGWLGVKIQTVTGDIAETLGLPENTGALVAAVTPDSPASKAGLVAGDVILKFDGKDVTSMRGLPKMVAQAAVGQAVDVELLRKGQKQNTQVTVGRLEDDDDNASDLKSDNGKDDDPKGSAIIGLQLSPLSDDLRKKYSLDDKIKGVVVEAVDPQSPAASKGLKVGDVIVEAAQDSVSEPDDVAKSIEKVKKAGRKAVLLRVENGKGDLRFVAVPVS